MYMLLPLLIKDVQERHDYRLANPANGMNSLNNFIVEDLKKGYSWMKFKQFVTSERGIGKMRILCSC